MLFRSGYTQLRKMPVEYFPQVDFPMVTVSTIYPGAGPEEIEERVTKPLEDEVAIINGVDDLSASSQENVSTVMIRFDLEVDLDVAAADVRDAVDRAKAVFPDDVEDPIVYKVDFSSAPVVSLGVTGKRSPKDLLTYVEDRIKPRFGMVQGVSSVNVTGGEEREIRVEADAERLEAVGLSVTQLAQIVAAENLDVPGGDLKEGGRSFAVRALGEFESVDEIRKLRVSTPYGGIVYLDEIATVSDTIADPDTISRLDGKATVSVNVIKQTDANTVVVSAGVHEALEEMRRELPEDITFSIFMDGAESTQEAVRDVEEALILGALLAAAVTFLFLKNFRAMIIVVLAIPTSIIATFLPIYFFGFTVNVMTLMALSLSVGILVDDSIVVIENIERHLRMGESPAVAALNGRSEIGGAAVAITLVDVVVFVPVAFMGGIMGRFFYPFGITVTVATLFSLLMSFTLTPMLASWWFSRETADRAERRERHWSRYIFMIVEVPFTFLERVYGKMLPVTLKHPYIAVILGYAVLVGVAFASIKSGRVQVEFFPGQATGRIYVMLESSPGTRLEVTDQHLTAIEEILSDSERYPEVEDVQVTAGTQGSVFLGAGSTGGQFGNAQIMLAGKTQRREEGLRSDAEFTLDLRDDLEGVLPSVSLTIARSEDSNGGIEPQMQVMLRSPNAEALQTAAATLKKRWRGIPELLYADLSSEAGRPEVRARIDRVRAADHGMTAAQIAMALRTAYDGDTSSQYREEGDEFDLRVQLAEADRNRLSEVERLFVGLSGTGQIVHLSDVANVYVSTGPSRIERYNRERSVTISAFLAEGLKASQGRVAADAVLKEMEDAGEFAGVRVHWTGEQERMEEEFGYMRAAIILAIALVYIVTAALYSHILQPLNVMLTVPMAFGGGLLALAIAKGTISIASLIGVIMLIGLVGKNAILVVDYANTLKARGASTREALLEAGPTRMRPILMTTISTVMALLPTALALNEASEFRAPMAHVVIGGLLLSTVLSLLIVPAFYTITTDVTEASGRLGERISGVIGSLSTRSKEREEE